MKKSKLLILFSVVIFAFSACTKDDDAGNDDQQTAEYYITYKANGATVTATEVTALRGTTESPRTLTIIGTGKEGANPKFKFFAKESFIGFVGGLSMGTHSGTTDSYYTEYTNSAGTLYTTDLDDDGIDIGFLELSYTNGGTARGSFSGSITAEDGSTVNITDGEFKVKFSN